MIQFVSQQLLLYLMQGFETCYTVQTCIWHMLKGNRILIQVKIAELCSPFVIALATSFMNRFLARLDKVQEKLLYYPGVGVGSGVGVSKKFNVKVFYVMGKALSGELSYPCDRSCNIT